MRKIIPFVILLLSFDSVSKNLFTLNKVTISEKFLKFSALAKKSVVIEWENLVKIEFEKKKGKTFLVHYKEKDVMKIYDFSLAFKNVLDILSCIKIMAPHIEIDEFVESLLYAPDMKK
jgi:hypothetical protein